MEKKLKMEAFVTNFNFIIISIWISITIKSPPCCRKICHFHCVHLKPKIGAINESENKTFYTLNVNKWNQKLKKIEYK